MHRHRQFRTEVPIRPLRHATEKTGARTHLRVLVVRLCARGRHLPISAPEGPFEVVQPRDMSVVDHVLHDNDIRHCGLAVPSHGYLVEAEYAGEESACDGKRAGAI